MRNRSAAAIAALLAIAVLGSCSARPPAQLASSALVTVNGKDSTMHLVKCTQLEWYRTIDIGSDFAGAEVTIDQRSEMLSAESVHIQNLGGFTGMYSRGDGGDADMSLSGDKFTITGTANGHEADKFSEPATAKFKIIATC